MISWRDTLLARHVYNLDPDAINDFNDLIERLPQVHYHGWPLSERLRSWLGGELGRKAHQAPVVDFVSHRECPGWWYNVDVGATISCVMIQEKSP